MRDKCILRLFMALPICLLLGCCMEFSVQAGNVTVPEKTQTATACRDIPPGEDQEITLGFAGDVNLDENWSTTKYLDRQKNGIADCFSTDLIQQMQQFDVFMLNNEFTYSTRGTPLKGKAYTFRADPSRVMNLEKLGTDVVLLANNHVYDYGKDAMLDTFDTLTQAGIPYVGAGRNLKEASAPVYFSSNGHLIAYVAASRAEKYKMTPQATESEPGILRCYDMTDYLEEIREADARADYVVASVHWGTEYDNHASELQRKMAQQMIDAGADAVIGTHPHVLQGMEYYRGKPIIYSLGNFWFNDKDLYTGMLELTLDVSDKKEDPQVKKVRFIPCVQYDLVTKEAEDDRFRQKIFRFEQKISFGVKISTDGTVTEADKSDKS